jgi:hypothetical protein
MTVTASPRIGIALRQSHELLSLASEQRSTLQQIQFLENQIPIDDTKTETALQEVYKHYFTLISLKQLENLVQIQSQKVLQNAAVSAFVQALELTPLQSYQKRFVQLKSCDILEKMPYHQLLRTTFFIEKIIPEHAENKTIYFKKTPHNIPRTLFYQKDTAIFLINKGIKKFVNTSQQYKRVRTAIRIPLQVHEPCSLVAQGVNLHDKYDVSYPAILHEIKIASMFSGKAEIIQMLFHTTFREGKQAAIFWPYHPVTLEDLINNKTLSRQAKLRLAEDLIVGLSYMHSKGIVHGDVKSNNVLTYTDEIGDQRVRWIDFGYSSNITEDLSWGTWTRGLYGSPYATAPEVLDTKPFTGDRLKAEMWSLGHLLYHLFFQGHLLPWSNQATSFINGEISSSELKEYIYDCLDRFATAFPEDNFVKFIYQLLHKDPDKRPTISGAVTKIQQLREEKKRH